MNTKIFKKSFCNFYQHISFTVYIHSIWPALGIIIGCFISFSCNNPNFNLTHLIFEAIGWTSIGALILGFICFYYFYYQNSKDIHGSNIYGDLLVTLNDCFANVHIVDKMHLPIEKENNPREKNKFKKSVNDFYTFSMITFCNELKNHFDKRTNSDCCVSIKVFEKLDNEKEKLNNGVLYPVCRSEKKVNDRDSKEYFSTQHIAAENTAFRSIIKDFDYWKKSGQKKVDLKYYNGTVKKDYSRGNYDTSTPNGPLYESEIVVPLLPVLNASSAKMCGFICVDSNKKHKFGTGYDYSILQGVADGVYNATIKYRTFGN